MGTPAKEFEGKRNVFENDKKFANQTDRELSIHIKVNPKKILKFSLFVVLLLAVFSLGRLTGGGGGAVAGDTSSFALTGWFAGIGGDDGEETEAVAEEVTTEGEAATAEEPAAEEETAAGNETVAEDAATEEEESADEEETVTEDEDEITIRTYTKVAISINGIQKEWKETWGKVTQISYTIKNNEEGTIKPSYFIMTLEGYNEEADKKKLTLPVSSQNIKAGQSISATAAIPSGFNYNQATVGRLENVQITLVLFDEYSKPIASYLKEFNLQG